MASFYRKYKIKPIVSQEDYQSIEDLLSGFGYKFDAYGNIISKEEGFLPKEVKDLILYIVKSYKH